MQGMVSDVLAAWRQAVRVREESTPGSPEHEVAVLVAEQLRELYHHVLAVQTAPAEVREALRGIQLPEPVAVEP